MGENPQSTEELKQRIAELEEEKRLNRQVQRYAEAMGIIYPLVISLDYLKNEYHMLEYEQFLNKTASWSGTVDELIAVGASTIPDPEYAEKFRELFGREKALAAFRSGIKELILKHPQWGDDGKIHWMETRVIPLGCSEERAEAVSVSKCIDEEKQAETVNKQLEEQNAVFRTLSRNFKNLYLVNIEEETARVLKYEDEYPYGDIESFGGRDFYYVDLLNTWIDAQVHPEDRDMLRKDLSPEHLREVFASEEEYVGNYRMLVDGKIINYQFNLSRADIGEYLIAGFQNIESIIQEHLKTENAEREKEAAHQKEVDEQLAIIDTLSRSFLNVFVANMEDGTARAIRLADSYQVKAIREVEKEVFSFDDVVKRWIRETVHPDDREKIKAAINLANIRKVLSEQDEFVGNYRSIEDGVQHYYQFDFRRIGNTESVVAGFQIVDAIIEEQEAKRKREKELERTHLRDEREHTEIINSLATIYSTVIKVEIDTHRYEVFASVALMDKVAGRFGNFDDTREQILSAFMDSEAKDAMAAFLNFDTLAQRLKELNTIAAEYKAPNGQWKQARFIVKRRDEAGTAKEAIYVVRDITEDKAREDERTRKESALEKARLKELREHAEVIDSLSTIYSTIFVANINTHEYEILNSVPLMGKVAASKGNFDDVKDLIIESFMEPEFRKPLSEFLDLNTLADRLEKGNTVTTDYKAPTGQWMQARFIAKRRDENGRAVEILYVARDITEEKTRDLEQQEALSHALAAAQQANKAKTTFLNSMSHDIRTPMNAIIGFTALAQTHLEDHAQVEDYLSKISTSSNHLLSLINDILDMSRIESGTVKLEENTVHIPDLLHDLRTMIQSLVNSKNLNLFIDTQDVTHEDVLADKLRLNQVLLNIVGNAIKFTKPGGDIMIRLMEKPCNLKHYTTYVFSVKDNGIGMSKEFVGHIFDTFSREYSATVSGIQGTGLGMAITKNIVDMMGGDIQVESEEGKGSLFTVTLNLRLANETVKNEPIPELLGARALVVDDDMDTCRSVSKMLRDIQMRPDWTTSAKEAVARAQDAAEMQDEYKAFIIDYLMPDMNGIETVRRIRRVISEAVPIIVLTAYDWADFEHEAREAGVTAFVSKPIFMSELREVLTQPTASKKAAKVKKKHYDYSDKRVLLVEDNTLNREIATAILEETGMTIDSVEDGDLAVATINREPADKYDLILMDIQMPRMDGYTATREIRTLADNQKANIPIIAMTANAFEEDRTKAFESGMNGHIIKPISMEAIAKTLDEIFSEKK